MTTTTVTLLPVGQGALEVKTLPKCECSCDKDAAYQINWIKQVNVCGDHADMILAVAYAMGTTNPAFTIRELQLPAAPESSPAVG
jgi:S-adenosylmethionine synthetase